jgi:hypothetical protein
MPSKIKKNLKTGDFKGTLLTEKNIDPIAQRFDEGIRLHQEGDFMGAQAAYEFVLQSNPKHFDALNLLGVLAQTLNDLEGAEFLIQQSLNISPTNEYALLNLGNVYKAGGLIDKAMECYRSAINNNSLFAQAYFNLAVAFEDIYDIDQALENYDKTINADPYFSDAYTNKGNILKTINRVEEALENYTRAIKISPEDAQTHYNLAIVYKELSQIDKAIECYDLAIKLAPLEGKAYFNKGNLLVELRQFEKAIICFHAVLELDSRHAQAHHNLGGIWKELGHIDFAIKSYESAIEIDPNYYEAYNNLGNLFLAVNKFEEALFQFENALSIKPDYAQAHSNRGNALKELHQFDEALKSYDNALEIMPDFEDANWNKALTLLLCEDYEKGWPLYEWRWKLQKQRVSERTFRQPKWSGHESLKNKTILIYAEQGLGDTIQFIRYAKQLFALGAKVLVEVPSSLVSLLQTLEDHLQIFQKGDALPGFDFQISLLSLPLAFQTLPSNIPSYSSYLSVNPSKKSLWEFRLGPKKSPRIGLVWSGNADHSNDHHRSLALDTLIHLLPKNLEYICLQDRIRDTDKNTFETSPIRHFGSDLLDFSETAALCQAMDLIISVDTSVAHLSAALGKPTWILLPYLPDWRWMINKSETPWYPSAKLYRQQADRHWEPVLNQMTIDLEALFL